jgi:hypothetical protein
VIGRRFIAALHAALGAWLAHEPPPVAPKGKNSWFGCDPDTLRAALSRDPDEAEMTELDRKFSSRVNTWDPWGRNK